MNIANFFLQSSSGFHQTITNKYIRNQTNVVMGGVNATYNNCYIGNDVNVMAVGGNADQMNAVLDAGLMMTNTLTETYM